uniref:Peptidase A1 domain-containing protein n=1 Tax=Gongylonema pulchrum TaxID=637853 RepID=A0A183EVT0_9BILA
LLENMAASFVYANITNQNYERQQYQFDAIFIHKSANVHVKVQEPPLGYITGQLIQTDASDGIFGIPFGMDCSSAQEAVVKFGIQISTACRIRCLINYHLD